MANTTGIDTSEQRQREFITILNGKIKEIFKNYMHELRYDRPGHNGAQQIREIAWLLGNSEFHLSYHELPEVPGTARYRIRTQPYQPSGVGTKWTEIATWGELEGALRAEVKSRIPTASDLKALNNNDKHEGKTPDGLILVGLSGSKAYGLSHNGYLDPETNEQVPASDTDIRGIFVTNTRDLLLVGNSKDYVEQKKESDTVYDEIKRFMELCMQCNPERLELLATCRQHGILNYDNLGVGEYKAYLETNNKLKSIANNHGQLLVDNQDMFLSRRAIATYGGYAKQQLMKIERKEARRTKPAMHLIRLMLTGIGVLKNLTVNPDMTEYRDKLLAIRTGEMPLGDVLIWHRELEKEYAKAIDKTKLPDKPDLDRINNILLHIRRENLVW